MYFFFIIISHDAGGPLKQAFIFLSWNWVKSIYLQYSDLCILEKPLYAQSSRQRWAAVTDEYTGNRDPSKTHNSDVFTLSN